MKLYILFAVMDLIILLAYPLAYIANRIQKLTGAKNGHGRRQE
jgi:NADH:ubiquinone oxidoreductase subunit 3 (subunit A)